MAVGDPFVFWHRQTGSGDVDVRPASGTAIQVTSVWWDGTTSVVYKIRASALNGNVRIEEDDDGGHSMNENGNNAWYGLGWPIIDNTNYIRFSRAVTTGDALYYVAGIVMEE